jgi:hypothetical protein
MPLLQFLDYYQSVEFYFPQYWNAELIWRIRRIVSDPRFDTDEDSHINQLVAISAERGGRGGSSERAGYRVAVNTQLLSGVGWSQSTSHGSTPADRGRSFSRYSPSGAPQDPDGARGSGAAGADHQESGEAGDGLPACGP